MNRPTRGWHVSLITTFSALAASALVACGGGGGTTTYAVGGSVSGLPDDASVTLQNNGGDALTVSGNGAFSFPAPLPAGRAYSVTLKSRTPGLRCSLNRASGSIGQGAVTDIAISCVTGSLSIVHHFAGAPDGAQPMGELMPDGDGNFYSTTLSGGTLDSGTLYKLDATGTVTVLHSLGAQASPPYGPRSGLARDASGNFYLAVYSGGTPNFGAIVKVDPAGSATILHEFDMTDPLGVFPSGSLFLARDGNLYGTTESRAAYHGGALFQITPAGASSLVHSFGDVAADALTPQGELAQDEAGNLYGASQDGGSAASGTVYKVSPGGAVTVIHSFGTGATTGLMPQEGITRDAAGNLYGTTAVGGGSGNPGTVFKVSPSGVATDLHAFSTASGDGYQPLGGVVADANGNVFGTTSLGGAHGHGIVFKISRSGVYTVLHEFNPGAGDGGTPKATLTIATDGTLYGTTNAGGASGHGTIFKID